MSNAEDLKAVEISIEQAKAAIKRQQCLERLEKNPDFKELILEGYLKTHAIRQVMLKSSPQLQDEKRQIELTNQIIGIGQFNQYLLMTYALGNNAVAALSQHEETQAELLQEGIDNE